MKDAPRLAVVTGFGRFGPYPDNPTRRITEKLMGAKLGNVLVEGIVLPNEYDTHHTVMQFISDCQKKHGISKELPVTLVSGGLSTSLRELSLEAVGWNEIKCTYRTDSGTVINDGRAVEQGAPGAYFTNANLFDVSLALRRSCIPAVISVEPGRFTCNSVFFGMLHLIAESKAPIIVVYYHSAFTTDDKGRIDLPPHKMFMPAEWLDKGVPAMMIDATRQADEMFLNGGVAMPVAMKTERDVKAR